jgi:hypothetical protein
LGFGGECAREPHLPIGFFHKPGTL